MSLYVTNCSTRGGSTDATIKNGCDGYVQKKKSSTIELTIRDGGGTLGTVRRKITYERHHDVVSFRLPRAAIGDVTVTARTVSGPAVLVHGPHSRFVAHIPLS